MRRCGAGVPWSSHVGHELSPCGAVKHCQAAASQENPCPASSGQPAGSAKQVRAVSSKRRQLAATRPRARPHPAAHAQMLDQQLGIKNYLMLGSARHRAAPRLPELDIIDALLASSCATTKRPAPERLNAAPEPLLRTNNRHHLLLLPSRRPQQGNATSAPDQSKRPPC